MAQAAYVKKQAELGTLAQGKHKRGEILSAYERQVRTDDRRETQRYWKQMAGNAGGIGLGVASFMTAPVSVPLAVGLAMSGAALEGSAALSYTINSKRDVAIVAGSAIVGGATMFLPGSGIEVSFARKTLGREAAHQGVEITMQRLSGLDLAGSAKNQALQHVENPGRIQSRINIRTGEGTNKAPGLDNTWRKHGSDAVDTKSKFTISKDELKVILSDPKVIQSPVKLDQRSGSFVREVNIGNEIGNLSIKDGRCPTTTITILTDGYGNLINVYPGPFFTKR